MQSTHLLNTQQRPNPHLPSHLMTRDRNEEEVSLIRIIRTESTISNILEEVTLAGVLAGELPGRLVKRIGIPIRIYIHLEILLHLPIIQPKNLRRMINIRKWRILLLNQMFHSANHLHSSPTQKQHNQNS